MKKLISSLTLACVLGFEANLASAQVSKPPLTYLPNRNFSSREETPSVIVLHDTEDTNLKRVLRLFRSRAFGNNAHFTIAKDGKIYQTAPLNTNAGHAGKSIFNGRKRVNDFSIGIELVNKGDGKDPFTDSQYASLSRLVAWLMVRYNISWSHVTTHKDIALPHGRKEDPRPPFSISHLKQLVDKEL